ncbi:hypothetical protein F511_05197 [Dorcoceras hygrometricum]|uniref:Uncharacterized protein n=1 Tax=Dorcoceras hygrometricum TaxID=472368 RepID=A0A2Z7C292_9LAMI|nr:hypothetical protein F511_05197 [Dorcoceras hygrometricum]
MDHVSRHAEESQFFGAMEQVSLTSGLLDDYHSLKNWEYDVWINSPQSVTERRRKFIRWMGLRSDGLEGEDFCKQDIGRVMENSGVVQETPAGIENRFSSGPSSASIWSSNDLDSSVDVDLVDVRSDNGSEGVSNVIGLVANLVEKEVFVSCSEQRATDKLKDRLLNRLRSISCMACGAINDDNVQSNNDSRVEETRIRRVKVQYSRRRMKKLSALFTGQDIPAHEGPILAMKFSHSGKFLASSGEDKFVRVWLVVEDDRSDLIDIPESDPSSVYFLMDNESELGSLQKDNINESKRLKKTQDSACIVFPPKVFRILEKPLHLFEGHKAEILDLSWSKNDCLLSASIDKTVRLWRVGVDHCLKVFSHNSYVTCIQFNPLNDDYFISGSIDGKVRIWTINGCQVVDWTETKEIITAISYRPNGQGGVIGSITGTCQFFNISDNRLQLENQVCFASKKKSPCKRITGFQFLPHDPSKVLVTCANSEVRVIDGTDVIRKYKGIRNGGNQISASFTSDGKHIVSASDDSSVYMWNYINPVSHSQPKSIRSFECFSSDASVVIPWPGFQIANSANEFESSNHENSKNPLPFSLSAYFSSGGQEFFLDSQPKGSTTWPEEKLPVSYPRDIMSSMCKSQYKLVKACCQSTSSSSHAWGLVLVTAGWDGKIRSFHNYGLPIPH